MTLTYLNFSVCFHPGACVEVRGEPAEVLGTALGQQVWWEAPGLKD